MKIAPPQVGTLNGASHDEMNMICGVLCLTDKRVCCKTERDIDNIRMHTQSVNITYKHTYNHISVHKFVFVPVYKYIKLYIWAYKFADAFIHIYIHI